MSLPWRVWNNMPTRVCDVHFAYCYHLPPDIHLGPLLARKALADTASSNLFKTGRIRPFYKPMLQDATAANC